MRARIHYRKIRIVRTVRTSAPCAAVSYTHLMFREVADIQTADMLKLPVPKVNYHNIKTLSLIHIFPILGQEYSRADFEEKLTENPANDHLKVMLRVWKSAA